MYGLMHVVLKDLTVSLAGEAGWTEVLTVAQVLTPEKEAQLLDTTEQSDELSFRLIAAACSVLGRDADSLLHSFGRHFVMFVLRSGSISFLRSQGATLHSFLSNINSLHTYMERDHPDARFPFIDVTYDAAADCINLSYLSSRAGLKSMVIGIIQEIGNRLYGLEVAFEEQQVAEDVERDAAEGCSVAWRITWTKIPGGPEPLQPISGMSIMPFPVLHDCVVKTMRGFQRVNPFRACQSSSGASTPRSQALRRADTRDSDDGELMAKQDSDRKVIEVRTENRRGRAIHRILLRATQAHKIAAAWSDQYLPQCQEFWKSSEGRPRDYGLSEDSSEVDVFVSHCWSQPKSWHGVMGKDVDYAEIKSTQLAIMAKDVALMNNHKLHDWKSVTLWVDKACIPQDNPELKQSCIGLIENFIQECQNVCILFTWSYLERLWCLYEMACVLIDKEPSQVWLQIEGFVNEASFPLYLDSIRNFALQRAKCRLAADRRVLAEKIKEGYVSEESFERLVKACALALMARSMAYRAGRSQGLHEKFYRPLVDLAYELGFADLADELKQCKPWEWRHTMLPTLLRTRLGRRASMSVSASRYQNEINAWFNTDVSPILKRMRRNMVRNRHGAAESKDDAKRRALAECQEVAHQKHVAVKCPGEVYHIRAGAAFFKWYHLTQRLVAASRACHKTCTETSIVPI